MHREMQCYGIYTQLSNASNKPMSCHHKLVSSVCMSGAHTRAHTQFAHIHPLSMVEYTVGATLLKTILRGSCVLCFTAIQTVIIALISTHNSRHWPSSALLLSLIVQGSCVTALRKAAIEDTTCSPSLKIQAR